MRILAAYENRRFAKPIEYTVRFCLGSLRLPAQIVSYEQLAAMDTESFQLLLTYGKRPPNVVSSRSLHIFESDFFSDRYLKVREPIQRPIVRYHNLPVLFPACNGDTEIIRKVDATRIELNADMIASIFFFLSRYEEVVVPDRDEHGRFPAAASLAMREGFLERPIVNEYLELVRSVIADLCPQIEPLRLWDGKDFCSVLSFDVDAPFKYGRRTLVSLLGSMLKWGKGLREIARSARESSEVAAGKKRDPYFVFDYLLEQQKRYSANATYYILCDRTSRWDAVPQIGRPEVRAILAQLAEAGCEIGLHGSYGSCDSAEQLRREKQRLEAVVERKVSGVRQHFLRLHVPRTWRLQAEAGLRYDATLGFADAEGFRAGMCLPFRPFDLEQNCEMNLWVVPLCVMDATLKQYRRLSPEQARERIFALVDTVKRHRGVFTLLWHNSSFDEMHWQGWRAVFESVLRYLAEQGTLFLSAQQLIERMEAGHLRE